MKRTSLTLLVLSLSLPLIAIDRANAGGESQSPRVEKLKGYDDLIDFPENNKDPRLQTVPLDGVQRRGAARQAPIMIDESVFEKIAPAGANNPCPKFFDWIPNPMDFCREWRDSYLGNLQYRYPDSEVMNFYACRFNEEQYAEWLSLNAGCPENLEMGIDAFGFACQGVSDRRLDRDALACPISHRRVIYRAYRSGGFQPSYSYRYACLRFGDLNEICETPSSGTTRNVYVDIDLRPDDSVRSLCCATIEPREK